LRQSFYPVDLSVNSPEVNDNASAAHVLARPTVVLFGTADVALFDIAENVMMGRNRSRRSTTGGLDKAGEDFQ
jgi:hypothetical protein